jgi:glutamate synthase (NADPH/NADH) small chain
MDCGYPSATAGCPLGNRIPEFNEMVYKGQWKAACENLHSTNNFPEITGRICPAPCETACTLGVNDQPVLIRHIEYQIVERGFDEGWIVPQVARHKTGKRIAVIGSGPAGLAAAQQLARAGHDVTVFEKDERPGGLLRFGIPDFKLDKRIIDRRLEQLMAEGVQFQTGVQVGLDVSVRYLQKLFSAMVLTMGAGQPRDLVVPGRGFEGIHFAMEYLAQQNLLNGGLDLSGARDQRPRRNACRHRRRRYRQRLRRHRPPAARSDHAGRNPACRPTPARRIHAVALLAANDADQFLSRRGL